MTYSELTPAGACYGGKRIIIEEGKTVRIQMEGSVGNFDGRTIWRFRYISGPRYGEVRETYSLPSMFLAYTPFGKLIPAGRLVSE